MVWEGVTPQGFTKSFWAFGFYVFFGFKSVVLLVP